MIVFVFSLLITGLSYKLFGLASGSMSIKKLNIVSFTFYLWLIGMIFIGLTLLMLGVDNYAHRSASQDSLKYAYFSVCYVLIAMPLSMVFYQKFLFKGNIKFKLKKFFISELQPLQTKYDTYQLFFWGFLTGISFLALVYVYGVAPNTPFMSLLRGGSILDAAILRNDVKFEFSGNLYVRNLIVLKLIPLLSYIAYGYAKLYDSYKINLWFYVTVILSILALTFTGEKAPIVVYFATILILKSIINKKFSARHIVYLIVIPFIVIILMYTLLTDGFSFSLYGGPLSRLILVPSVGIRFTFDIFPSAHQFLYGASFPNWIVNIFGMEHVRSAKILAEIYNAGGIESGTAGVINSLYIAEAWANFGYLGLLLSPFIVGFVIQFLHNHILSKNKTPVYVALMGYFFFELPILGGFVDFIWNVGLIFVLMVIIMSLNFTKFMQKL